jgi:hypothetical protein
MVKFATKRRIYASGRTMLDALTTRIVMAIVVVAVSMSHRSCSTSTVMVLTSPMP